MWISLWGIVEVNSADVKGCRLSSTSSTQHVYEAACKDSPYCIHITCTSVCAKTEWLRSSLVPRRWSRDRWHAGAICRQEREPQPRSHDRTRTVARSLVGLCQSGVASYLRGTTGPMWGACSFQRLLTEQKKINKGNFKGKTFISIYTDRIWKHSRGFTMHT